MLTKWLQLSRLETRTKESNMYASVKVENLWTRNESKGRKPEDRPAWSGAYPTDLDFI